MELPFSGKSMNPLFKGATSVGVEFIDSKDVQLGDVVVYRDHSQEWLCHRVIRLKDNHFMVKGDKNTSVEAVEAQRIFAIVKSVNFVNKKINLKRGSIFLRILCFLQYNEVHISFRFFAKLNRYLALALLNFKNLFVK